MIVRNPFGARGRGERLARRTRRLVGSGAAGGAARRSRGGEPFASRSAPAAPAGARGSAADAHGRRHARSASRPRRSWTSNERARPRVADATGWSSRPSGLRGEAHRSRTAPGRPAQAARRARHGRPRRTRRSRCCRLAATARRSRSSAARRSGSTRASRSTCGDDAVELRTSVTGRGELTDVHLLGGRSLLPRSRSNGFMPSGSSLPDALLAQPVRSARPSAGRRVVRARRLGRRRARSRPLALHAGAALSRPQPGRGRRAGGQRDAGSISASPRRSTSSTSSSSSTRRATAASRSGSSTRDTRASTGRSWRRRSSSPRASPIPYAGLRRHRADLVARGAAPAPAARETPAWWREPIFCGWGAQCAPRRGGRCRDRGRLRDPGELRRLPRATSKARASCPARSCSTTSGRPRTAPTSRTPASGPTCAPGSPSDTSAGSASCSGGRPGTRRARRPSSASGTRPASRSGSTPRTPRRARRSGRASGRCSRPKGLDADGLKVDFTARTPTGRALERHGPGARPQRWGIALLHELLATLYTAAKDVKPDALVLTHTPHPAFVDVTDMIRLNDMVAGAPSVVPQMRHRARVARAACPELLVDTDDWRIPSLREWREYAEEKPVLGVPSLYYSQSLGRDGRIVRAAGLRGVAPHVGDVAGRVVSVRTADAAPRHLGRHRPRGGHLGRRRPRGRSAGAATSRRPCAGACSRRRSGSATSRTRRRGR